MLKTFTMTGSQVKVYWLYTGIDDTTDPDFSHDNVNSKSTFWAIAPEITLWADANNVAEIYLQEHASVDADEKVFLRPGSYLTVSYSYIEAMNIFYATGTSDDKLFIIVR